MVAAGAQAVAMPFQAGEKSAFMYLIVGLTPVW